MLLLRLPDNHRVPSSVAMTTLPLSRSLQVPSGAKTVTNICPPTVISLPRKLPELGLVNSTETELKLNSNSRTPAWTVHRVPIKTYTSYFMNNYVKNQVILMIFGTQKPEEISHKWDLACPPRGPEKYYHCTLRNIDVIKFPLFPSKIGYILNRLVNCYTTRQLKFQKSKIAETVKVSTICVHQTL